MAVTYGFYDSLNHDRLYNAQQMSAIFDGIINDGVFMSVGNQFHTVAGTGMQVIVKSGRAWFDSTWTLNDAEYPLSIDAADVLLTRIDAVVLEVNSDVATRANTIKVVKGTPASTPAKPTLTNTATIHQHALAYVTVAKNTTAITNSMIEIVVGKTETPYVTAILQTTDITDLYNQWEDYFQKWFDTVRGTLDGDVALNLQNQITTLRRETLKNTTPPIIGLPSSATPDDMFQALGNTGELHVWRKTVTTAQDIPAGYTLGASAAKTLAKSSENSGNSYATFYISSSISVDDAGNVTMDSPATVDIWQGIDAYDSDERAIFGKFIKFHSVSSSNAGITSDLETGIYFIPNSAEFTRYRDGKRSGYTNISACQKVNAYPKTPAGTTSTYPVSTNPNAYQEGSDAKPAGYTLGEVVSGKFRVSLSYAHGAAYWKYGTSLTVSDDGTVDIANPASVSISGSSSSVASAAQQMAGKYAVCTSVSDTGYEPDFPIGTVVFFPSDTLFTTLNVSCWASKYQPVTGYAAIPAGTTIEYLGKLGDKARMQVVSYVGTGTYGSDHPNSLTFNFVPKVVMIRCDGDSNFFDAIYGVRQVVTEISSGRYVTVKWSKKTLSWYSADDQWTQMNNARDKYYAIAIG